MTVSRRQFFALAGSSAMGGSLLYTLQALYAKKAIATSPYGPLIEDPDGVIDLPAGFTYVRLSETGQTMSDGLRVPAGHDGMGAFPGPNGNTILIRNHELTVSVSLGLEAPEQQKYDPRAGGGTTTLEVTSDRTLVRHFGSLAGTVRNCAGGTTPWGSWLSCEETFESNRRVRHGYVFEVPASENGFITPTPLTAMGRFNHEAAAVDPNTGDVYMTEDRGNSLIYRFVPNSPGNLSQGGELYALRIPSMPQVNTKTGFNVRDTVTVDWVPINEPDPDEDTVRDEGFSQGAAQFSRGEGMFYGNRSIYFCCTSGGSDGFGQVWRYTPGTNRLALVVQPTSSTELQAPDNVAVGPRGNLFLCEDGDGTDFLVGVTLQGALYQFARNRLNTGEFAGICFSPDGETMFVNLQIPGITLAIQGPW
ncbi:MAG: PhoX family protein [Leptolyngbyaceae cyanobacterium MAG.088]|nr:PhoX family protein [Leptolyngbyaceae cyanobacterium MAG.088]